MKSFCHRTFCLEKSILVSRIAKCNNDVDNINSRLFKHTEFDGSKYTKVRSKLSNEEMYSLRQNKLKLESELYDLHDQLNRLENDKQNYIFNKV